MTVLAQLIGPFQAVHGRFPDVPELRDLLASEETVAELRAELEAKGGRAGTWVREVDAYRRQARTGQLISLLEDRVALLGRPIFEGFFTAPGSVPGAHRPFSVRALDRLVRARIDLPERGHADVSRILARLLLAQFTVCAVARGDQSLLAGLVLDDAAQTVTSQALRGLQRLRSAHAGVPADLARPGRGGRAPARASAGHCGLPGSVRRHQSLGRRSASQTCGARSVALFTWTDSTCTRDRAALEALRKSNGPRLRAAQVPAESVRRTSSCVGSVAGCRGAGTVCGVTRCAALAKPSLVRCVDRGTGHRSRRWSGR
ncbi:hypothetical protein KBZ21_15795 [Streptomyces sp. A73]|nr:hypothetical protein [Streptomyces sp. A73]